MFYIHHKVCISPQNTFPTVDLENVLVYENNQLTVSPFSSEGIPNGVLRRMGKAVKYGVSAAIPIFKQFEDLDGIIIGTSNGGMEDCVKFLNQIMEYEEGVLTPTNFVQSTTNAIASQLGFFSNNKGYNITHVQRGLSFENAILDAEMLLAENPNHSYLLGGIDEISDYHYNIEYLAGWFKKEQISSDELYQSTTEGSIAGEGVALFVVNGKKEGASSCVKAIKTIHTKDENEVLAVLKAILAQENIDLLLSGENGDIRQQHFYEAIENTISPETSVARFKHLCGEYQTASSFALFLADHLLQVQKIPTHLLKKTGKSSEIKKILIYNNYQGFQHGFILVTIGDLY